MSRRKIVRMVLAVSVPAAMPSARARLEVRTLVNDQCNYGAGPGDVKVRSLGPEPLVKKGQPDPIGLDAAMTRARDAIRDDYERAAKSGDSARVARLGPQIDALNILLAVRNAEVNALIAKELV